MDLKKLLKTYKQHEGQLSVLIGIIILIISAVFVFRYVDSLRSNSDSTPAPVSEERGISHTVAKGESLWIIAEKYYQKGSDWTRIAEANGIDDASKIEIGQTITIPNVDITTATPETTEPSPIPQITDEAATTTNEITENTYTVTKGDSLWKIALRAYGDGNKWVDIASVNNLKNPSIIHTGNTFTIPR